MSFFVSKLKGANVLVTGAGSGIGKGMAVTLAKEGCNIFAFDRNEEKLKELEGEIGCKVFVFDVTDTKQVEEALEKIERVDYLLNVAGITILEPFLETKLENFQKIFNVNVDSVLILSQRVAKKMISQGIKGAIVNMSSQASQRSLIHHTSYCSSKAAIDQLTATMALELGPFGIRVNAINPTAVMTDMGKLAWSDPVKSKMMLDRIPMSKFAQVEDVVNTAIFLMCTDMVSGHCVPVDGGFWSAPFNMRLLDEKIE